MLRKYPIWRRRTACSLAYLLAFSTLSLPVFAADSPDQAPPPPPASDTSNPVTNQVTPAPPATTAPKLTDSIEPFSADSLGVLIFPIDVDESVQGAPKDLAANLPARISMALNRSNAMDSAVFYRDSPIIQRAIAENRLKPIMNGSSLPDRLPDSALPFIAREYHAKTIVSGSITGYVFDKTNNTIDIDLTLNQRDLIKGKNRLIVVSGQSKPSPVVSSEIALAAEASDDLALKTASAIAGVPTETITNASSNNASAKKADHVGKKKRSSFGIIAGALVLIAIIAAASDHHGGSSSTSGGSTDGGTPPSTPNL